jgi:hypothetical protein
MEDPTNEDTTIPDGLKKIYKYIMDLNKQQSGGIFSNTLIDDQEVIARFYRLCYLQFLNMVYSKGMAQRYPL